MSVETIVAELHRLREAQSDHEVMGSTAATSTLIVRCAAAPNATGVSEAARRMAIAHGARLILLISGKGNVQANVCAFCGREGTETVCCEQITLPVDAGDPSAVLGDVDQLLLQGLPGYLWWNGRGLDQPLFSGLRRTAKRIVVDTSVEDGDGAGLVELQRILEREPHARLWDLAWLRNAPWREMAARLFDDPARAKTLASLEAVEVEGEALADAALIAGWIGTQLGYAVSKKSAQFKTPTGGRVSFTYARSAGSESVERIRLRVRDATFQAERQGNSVFLSVRSGGEQRGRCEPFVQCATEQLVSDALFGLGAESAFRQSLKLAARLVSR
ncbi:MAG: glucose-6-phosphate dehydrogenase assembly protein OpcA [bacterium]|nr:glucose-6-phosphate dehydrogenase assembly protein OpcA [bacterium]